MLTNTKMSSNLRRSQSLKSLSGTLWLTGSLYSLDMSDAPLQDRRKSVSQLIEKYQSWTDLRDAQDTGEVKVKSLGQPRTIYDEIYDSRQNSLWRRHTEVVETTPRTSWTPTLTRSRSMDALSQRDLQGTSALTALFESKSTLRRDYTSSPRLSETLLAKNNPISHITSPSHESRRGWEKGLGDFAASAGKDTIYQKDTTFKTERYRSSVPGLVNNSSSLPGDKWGHLQHNSIPGQGIKHASPISVQSVKARSALYLSNVVTDDTSGPSTQQSAVKQGHINASKKKTKQSKFLSPVKDICSACQTQVYPMEKTVADDCILHINCFCCGYCKKKLSIHSYSACHGKFYCTSHYQQLFMRKGNYDEGFGYKQHKDHWIQKKESPQPESKISVAPKYEIMSVDGSTQSPAGASPMQTSKHTTKYFPDTTKKLDIRWPPEKKVIKHIVDSQTSSVMTPKITSKSKQENSSEKIRFRNENQFKSGQNKMDRSVQLSPAAQERPDRISAPYARKHTDVPRQSDVQFIHSVSRPAPERASSSIHEVPRKHIQNSKWGQEPGPWNESSFRNSSKKKKRSVHFASVLCTEEKHTGVPEVKVDVETKNKSISASTDNPHAGPDVEIIPNCVREDNSMEKQKENLPTLQMTEDALCSNDEDTRKHCDGNGDKKLDIAQLNTPGELQERPVVVPQGQPEMIASQLDIAQLNTHNEPQERPVVLPQGQPEMITSSLDIAKLNTHDEFQERPATVPQEQPEMTTAPTDIVQLNTAGELQDRPVLVPQHQPEMIASPIDIAQLSTPSDSQDRPDVVPQGQPEMLTASLDIAQLNTPEKCQERPEVVRQGQPEMTTASLDMAQVNPPGELAIVPQEQPELITASFDITRPKQEEQTLTKDKERVDGPHTSSNTDLKAGAKNINKKTTDKQMAKKGSFSKGKSPLMRLFSSGAKDNDTEVKNIRNEQESKPMNLMSKLFSSSSEKVVNSNKAKTQESKETSDEIVHKKKENTEGEQEVIKSAILEENDVISSPSSTERLEHVSTTLNKTSVPTPSPGIAQDIVPASESDTFKPTEFPQGDLGSVGSDSVTSVPTEADMESLLQGKDTSGFSDNLCDRPTSEILPLDPDYMVLSEADTPQSTDTGTLHFETPAAGLSAGEQGSKLDLNQEKLVGLEAENENCQNATLSSAIDLADPNADLFVSSKLETEPSAKNFSDTVFLVPENNNSIHIDVSDDLFSNEAVTPQQGEDILEDKAILTTTDQASTQLDIFDVMSDTKTPGLEPNMDDQSSQNVFDIFTLESGPAVQLNPVAVIDQNNSAQEQSQLVQNDIFDAFNSQQEPSTEWNVLDMFDKTKSVPEKSQSQQTDVFDLFTSDSVPSSNVVQQQDLDPFGDSFPNDIFASFDNGTVSNTVTVEPPSTNAGLFDDLPELTSQSGAPETKEENLFLDDAFSSFPPMPAKETEDSSNNQNDMIADFFG